MQQYFRDVLSSECTSNPRNTCHAQAHVSHSRRLSHNCVFPFCPCLCVFLLFPSFLQCSLPPGCPGFCVEIYQPVCGTNGQTYGNTCELQVVCIIFIVLEFSLTPSSLMGSHHMNPQASCQSSTSISAAYEGACVGGSRA